MPSLANFFHTQLILKIPLPTSSFEAKTVIVTGANGGLGKEIVKHLIRLGADKIIFACRSQSRGEEAKAEIEAVTHCDPAIIQVWTLDVASSSSIKAFVDKVNTLPRLDVVINNAGIGASSKVQVYGTESTLGINVIGTFLLAVQLIPKLRETARKYETTPHMTFVGSALYDIAKYPENHGDDIFSWFSDDAHFDKTNQYNLSKLLQLYAVIKMCAAIDPVEKTNLRPIVVNSLDPCFCKTGLVGGLTGVARIFFNIFQAMFARTAEEGSRLVVQAAAAGRKTHGLYLRAGEVQAYAPIALDNEKATCVWETLCKRLEQIQPGVLENLN
ncbi:hypothetical protein PFICI_04725 [Pestalotiopsis fici W106-1]|uniref:NAD(P)-binding protein n=1 Tax=Pestalotiopsis fici (strain W106-1 / CGMCC3.15140) TaxID=1229662 RepID=W3X9Z7_PESFW|nr:uncharacterized protein PFICI_04725 [Pestalotiopsis fici W106-1]ETS82849.1 hypothetical protein PFICI_04725 [Pestalotiopsis fici W106-1]